MQAQLMTEQFHPWSPEISAYSQKTHTGTFPNDLIPPGKIHMSVRGERATTWSSSHIETTKETEREQAIARPTGETPQVSRGSLRHPVAVWMLHLYCGELRCKL